MRFIKFLFLSLLAVALLTVAFANSDLTTLTLLPGDMGVYAGFNASVSVPLYAIILGSIGTGLVIGFLWEWLRETKHRNEALRQRTEARRLERSIESMLGHSASHAGRDEILGLLEDGLSVSRTRPAPKRSSGTGESGAE